MSFSGDLLAVVEAVRRRCVARAWRALLGTLDGEGLLKWEETFRTVLRRGQEGAQRSGRPSAVKGRSEWDWSTARVFHWEFGWKVPLREKPRSASVCAPGRKGHRGKSRSE